jgi:hypothetical protein
MDCFLRLLHGSRRAWFSNPLDTNAEATLRTAFRFKLYKSMRIRRCIRESAEFEVDMLNLPGRHSKYGVRNFIRARECRNIPEAPSLPDVHICVEIRHVTLATATVT